HARALSTFLTGAQARKTDGANIRSGVSIDQVAAAAVGKYTRLPSLEIGCDRGAQSGNCDSGYSCSYSTNISWKSESTPMAKEIDPRLVYERLVASGSEAEKTVGLAERLKRRKSVLDYVMADAKSLHGRFSGSDRRKVDEYLTSVREIEQRIESAENVKSRKMPAFQAPGGVPNDYRDHIRLMGDLMVLAFQSDLTRICTYVLANDGSNRTFPNVEVTDAHHELSHHGKDAKKLDKIQRIDQFYIEQFAYILEKMKNTVEGDGSLLDQSMVVFGSGISDGDRHNHDDLPVLMAGKAGGALKTGLHVRYAQKTPMCNLYVSMLRMMGASVDRHGDSKGPLKLPTV
ncbi:MAG: DUF1552 domain-containing protein, partial [Planctomycetia bacterium]